MNIWSTAWTSTDKHANETTERIAHLEQLVGRLTLALDIQKKTLGKSAEIPKQYAEIPKQKHPQQKHVVELKPSKQRHIVETLRTEYSVRQICETLGFNKSTLYYQPKTDAPEDILREEIERLAETRYPAYGYRRITKLLECSRQSLSKSAAEARWGVRLVIPYRTQHLTFPVLFCCWCVVY